MVTRTISLPELVWTVFTGIGFLFNARITYRAIIDLVSLRVKRINSIREYAAITTVLAFSSWTLVQLGFVVVGISAMTSPSVHAKVALQQYITLAVFLFISGLLALTAFTVDKRRSALARKLKEIDEGWNDQEAEQLP